MKLTIGFTLAFICLNLSAQSQQVYMSEDEKLGCSIILCLASPNGGFSEPGCKEPLNQLKKRLMKFWKKPALPRCSSVENEGTNYKIEKANYEACPLGYEALENQKIAYITTIEDAQSIMKMSADMQKNEPISNQGIYVVGIGTGDDYENAEDRPDKICVKAYLGGINGTYKADNKDIAIYEKVQKLNSPVQGTKYKVFIKNQLYKEGDLN